MTRAGTARIETTAHSSGTRAVLYRPHWRVLAALLKSISGLSLLVILASLLFSNHGPANPLRLIRLVTGLCLLPGLAATLIRWTFAAGVRLDVDTLVLQARHARVEVPLGSVTAVEPWILPLPGAGVRLRLRSGRRWADGLQIDDPSTLIDMLVEAGASRELRTATRHPSLVYARASAAIRPRGLRHLVVKYPLFALVPALPLFRVHQLIAYGGVFGEYYQYGMKAYLLAFAIYWVTLTVYLMLYAAALRAPIELFCIAATVFAPGRAYLVRKIAERVGAVLFYGGVPLFVILRLLPW